MIQYLGKAKPREAVKPKVHVLGEDRARKVAQGLKCLLKYKQEDWSSEAT